MHDVVSGSVLERDVKGLCGEEGYDWLILGDAGVHGKGPTYRILLVKIGMFGACHICHRIKYPKLCISLQSQEIITSLMGEFNYFMYKIG